MTSTERPSADWLGHAELRLPDGLVLSFQRYALPESGVIEEAPASLGALPVGIARDGELLLPLAQRECFWIGLRLEAVQPLGLAVALEREDGALIDMLSGDAWDARAAAVAHLPGTQRIEGIRRSDGAFDPLLRDDGEGRGPQGARLHFWVRSIHERAAARSMVLQLVDYATFTARTGLPPPDALDPDAGYKGWLLP
jgi:hypothetical protein